MDTKRCPTHNNGEGADLPVSSFYRIKKGAAALQGNCKECMKAYVTTWQKNNSAKTAEYRKKYRDANKGPRTEYQMVWRHQDRSKNPEKWTERNLRGDLKKNFGMTLEQFQEKSSEQDDVCAICGEANGERRLNVDHDHKCCPTKGRSCGKCVRGLLCGRCNHSIERLESIPGWAEKALAYLKLYSQSAVSKQLVEMKEDIRPRNPQFYLDTTVTL